MLSLTQTFALPPGDRYALDLLIDLSTVALSDSGSGAVRVEVIDSGVTPSLPVLRGRQWGFSSSDGVLRVERALLTFVKRIAGGEAEQHSKAVDRYNRVPSSESPLVQSGVERHPVVSVAARTLMDVAREAAGARQFLHFDPWPNGHRWAAALTHDLDVVQWWPAFTALRLTELARRGQVGRLAKVVAAAAGNVGRDVVLDGVRAVLETEARHGARSTWFVLSGTPTLASAWAGDLTYRPESPPARRILAEITAAGHEIGLHGSFETSDRHELFGAQRERLESIVGQTVRGIRQHYLRLRPSSTPVGMDAAGFTYDSSIGFSDRNGFRRGAADVLPIWIAATESTLSMEEVPFAWMDRALSKYQGVEDPDVWIDDALSLADECRAVHGLWVGIWHPNLTPALGFPGALDAYTRLVAALAARDAFMAPIAELIAWRRMRRGARVETGDESGTLTLTGVTDDGPYPLVVRDANDEVVPWRRPH